MKWLQSTNTSSKTQIFKDCEFWIWNKKTHEKLYNATNGKCCFNHIVGLPEKEHLVGRGPPTEDNELGKPLLEIKTHPLYDYQESVIKSVLNLEPTMVEKATGMGITTLTLRLMCWLALKDDELNGQSMGIVTGPRLDIAKEEIGRIPRIFENVNYTPTVIGTSITINECTITAYPSHTFDSARGLELVRFFFIDEGDFFPIGQQVKARHVWERYIAKTHPMIMVNSTPNLPGGLMDTIKHEGESSIYTIHSLPYTKGMGKIFADYEINEAKKSPSFPREYNLQYGIGIGNIFNPKLIDLCTMNYPLTQQQNSTRILNIDPAFGESETSSKFGVVGIEKRMDNKKYVIHAEQRHRPSPEDMTDYIARLYHESNYSLCLVDAAHPGLVRDWNKGSDKTGRKRINAKGVPFGNHLESMTIHATTEVSNDMVRFHPSQYDLMAQLKGIEFKKDKSVPDKKKMTFDMGDAFMMGLDYWNSNVVMRMLKGKF
jgi:hypothetical protein